jgi:hypothetical protein
MSHPFKLAVVEDDQPKREACLNRNMPKTKRDQLRARLGQKRSNPGTSSALCAPLSSQSIAVGSRDFTCYDLMAMSPMALRRSAEESDLLSQIG